MNVMDYIYFKPTHTSQTHILSQISQTKKTLKTSYKYKLTQIPLHPKQTLKIHTYYKPKYISPIQYPK